MKKIFTLIAGVLLASSAMAQSSSERVVVKTKTGQVQGFKTERLEEISFPKVEGDVAADITIKKVDPDTVFFSIMRTDPCRAYRFYVYPKTLANKLTDDATAAAYMDKNATTLYQSDFTNGAYPTVEMQSNVDYVAMSVGYDEFGTPCEVRRAPFTTIQKSLVGNPTLTGEVITKDKTSYTLKVSANADVASFAAVTGEKGSFDQQLEQWGAMMGLTCMGDLVKSWGFQGGASKDTTFVWTGMNPGQEYEILLQGWDKAGTYMPLQRIYVKTDGYGGSGVATVSITLGDYAKSDWYGEEKYGQTIVFTANDQAAMFRCEVDLAANYDQDKEGALAYLKSEPPFPGMPWYQYETFTNEYQIDPGQDVVAFAIAKNADGAWGDLAEKRFTTPTVSEASIKRADIVNYRMLSRKLQSTSKFSLNAGKVPTLPAKRVITLTESK